MASSDSESEGEFASAESDTEEVSGVSQAVKGLESKDQRSNSSDTSSSSSSSPSVPPQATPSPDGRSTIPSKTSDNLPTPVTQPAAEPVTEPQPPSCREEVVVADDDDSLPLVEAVASNPAEKPALPVSDSPVSTVHAPEQHVVSTEQPVVSTEQPADGAPKKPLTPEQLIETEDPVKSAAPSIQQQELSPHPSAKSAGEGGGGWGGWGGWGGSLWSSVSTVGQKVTAVIASVEGSLGVPSPQELAQEEIEEKQLAEEVCRLADDVKEHDVSPDNLEPVKEEPHHEEIPPAKDDLPVKGGPLNIEGDEIPQSSAEPGATEHDVEPSVGGVSGFLSGFAAAVQSTSQGLVSGGLGALETIGKKTMEVLSEGDPRLVNKRAMLGVGPSSTLSQLLKEAKTEGAAARLVGEGEELDSTHSPPNYSRLFDEYHGVGHLEALELLSKECAGKTHSACAELSDGDFRSLQEKLAQLSECFTIDDEQENLDDDSSQLEEVKELFSNVTLPLKVDKLAKVSSGWREKVVAVCGARRDGVEVEERREEGVQGEEGESESAPDKNTASETLYENGLRSLAEMTSTAIELFRKMAEISLLPDVPQSEPLSQAQKFNRLTVLVSNELDALASVHSEAIAQLDLEGTNASVTSLYLESSNSGSYVQDAFQLLLPVLKLLLVQQLQVAEPAPPGVLSRN